MNDNLSAEETLKLASSQWDSANYIMKLGRVGRNKSYAIIHEIALSYYKDTKLRNRGLVPMSEVLKYFGIDLDYLKGLYLMISKKVNITFILIGDYECLR